MKIKTISPNEKPAFALKVSKYLSELLGVKISFDEVIDELFLYECGIDAKNEVLREYIVKIIDDNA